MSEEQNDSPAFRLRPRRAAPKSYYTVRLEYSANPAAFIRERPRSNNKRKVFTQKSGSNSTKTASFQNIGDSSLLLNVVSKEEKEREARRALLRRDIRESITTNTKISPFMQRVDLDELEADSVYEHNYITLRLKAVEKVDKDDSQILCCLAHGIDKSSAEQFVTIKLYNEYADAKLIQRGKMISIGKFRTSPLREQNTESNSDDSEMAEITYTQTDIGTFAGNRSNQTAQLDSNSETKQSPNNSIKSGDFKNSSQSGVSSKLKLLPFHIIVRYDEVVERVTPSANIARGGSSTPTSSSSMKTSLSRRLLMPFISITDMIEQPIEPFVEMSSSSCDQSNATTEQDNVKSNYVDHDHENQDAKKVKFTANVLV